MRILTAGFIACLFACGTALAASPVKVTDAWARATLPHQDEGVAYMTLQSQDGDTLTEIDSPQAGMVMLHQTKNTGGMAMMDDLASLALPTGQKVVLQPGGVHIMLMEMQHPLKAGETLHLSLHFTKAGVQDVAVPVLPVHATGPAH